MMNRQARITVAVECIRVFVYVDLMRQYKDESDQYSPVVRFDFQRFPRHCPIFLALLTEIIQ